MDVPIEMRTHEQNQLADFIPRVEERLRERDLEEQADDLAAVEFTLDESEQYAGKVASAPAAEWETLIQYLTILRPDETNRVWWLQKKLAGRLRERLDEMEGDN